MKFSYKGFVPNYDDGKLNKQQAMMDCVTGFKTFESSNCRSNLEQLGKVFKQHCVYSNIIWNGNHRKKGNAILDNIDMLILDIDNGLTIDEIIVGTPFQIMTLTTASHTDKHNKFRVFILLENPISFKDYIEYTELLKLIDLKYFKAQADKSCFEVGRAFITTSNATYRINENDSMLDCSELIKEAKINALSERLRQQPLFNDISTKRYNIEEVKRFPKVINLVTEFGKGNHYLPVFKIIGIAKTAGLSNEECAHLIMTYNIGGEYSDFNDLVKKAKKYK